MHEAVSESQVTPHAPVVMAATVPPPHVERRKQPAAVVNPPLNLDRIDMKLREAASRAPPTPAETSSPASDPENMPFQKESSRVATRTLEECIEIYENGPKPASVALSLLNDEEVIMLAQNGKIAPYALEKVLGDLQRAVLIRRALICE